MRVLRAHKDSVMAVLEAFVYDPLLNWRLMDCKLHLKQGVQTLGILIRIFGKSVTLASQPGVRWPDRDITK